MAKSYYTMTEQEREERNSQMQRAFWRIRQPEHESSVLFFNEESRKMYETQQKETKEDSAEKFHKKVKKQYPMD
jgi:hypothetical protein